MYSERFDEALIYASTIHRAQTRKGSPVPYITHLLAVAALVGEHGGNEDQIIAALLHDAIEDCIADIPDIRAQIETRFGAGVLVIVEACTDADVYPKPPWRERKEAYLDRLQHKADGDPSLLVALADKVHNARSIELDHLTMGDEIYERFRGKRDGTLWYYRSLVTIFSAKLQTPLVHELRRVVDALDPG